MMKLAIVFLPIVFAVIWMLFIGLRINRRDENRNEKYGTMRRTRGKMGRGYMAQRGLQMLYWKIKETLTTCTA